MASRVLAEIQAGVSPDQAAARALAFLHQKLGKIGGVIVVAPSGLLAWARTAAQMPCAHAWNGQPVSTTD